MPQHTRTQVHCCKVEGCENTGRYTRGYCKMHYARVLRHGDPGGAEKQRSVSWRGESCSVPGCDNQIKSLGCCNQHYKRLSKYGEPTASAPKKTPNERFLEKVQKSEGCWQWLGCIYVSGYGKFSVKHQQHLAHRWAYTLWKGPIPDGLVIDHLCRKRDCVNPDHLEAVTNEENLYRGHGYRVLNGQTDSCINGHKYTPENTYWPPDGGSARCRTCARARDLNRKR